MIETPTIDATHHGRSNPDLWDGREADAWTVTLTYDGRTMTTPYYMGLGLEGTAPTATDVLSSLFADASLYGECGDDPDAWREYLSDSSITVLLRTITVIARQASELRRLFGDDYDEATFVEWDAPDAND